MSGVKEGQAGHHDKDTCQEESGTSFGRGVHFFVLGGFVLSDFVSRPRAFIVSGQ
jgi:hypothetical protein